MIISFSIVSVFSQIHLLYHEMYWNDLKCYFPKLNIVFFFTKMISISFCYRSFVRLNKKRVKNVTPPGLPALGKAAGSSQRGVMSVWRYVNTIWRGEFVHWVHVSSDDHEHIFRVSCCMWWYVHMFWHYNVDHCLPNFIKLHLCYSATGLSSWGILIYHWESGKPYGFSVRKNWQRPGLLDGFLMQETVLSVESDGFSMRFQPQKPWQVKVFFQ